MKLDNNESLRETSQFKWVPEAPKIPGYYAAEYPVLLGKMGEKGMELGTTNIHTAVQFSTKEECEKWIAENSPPEWKATEHGFYSTPRMTTTEHLAKIRAKCVGLLDRNDYGGYCSAGWKSTIAAIDGLYFVSESDTSADPAHACNHPSDCAEILTAIIAAWPEKMM